MTSCKKYKFSSNKKLEGLIHNFNQNYIFLHDPLQTVILIRFLFPNYMTSSIKKIDVHVKCTYLRMTPF